MLGRWCFVVLALAAGVVSGPAAPAQEPPAESPTLETKPDEGGGVREVGPTVYYAWDEKSQSYKAILGTSLEELQKLEALRIKPADEARPERFHFAETGVAVAGSADAKRADLTLKLEIATEGDEWLSVPLRLNGAVLQSATFSGPGSHFVQYDDDAGHIAWIRPTEKTAKFQLEMKVLAPLTQVGEETRLDMKLPRASPVKLSLGVPMPKAQGAVSTGATIVSSSAEG
jgi:hypothetical protein